MKNFVKSAKCIDLHSHLYLPKYMQILRQRQQMPRVTQDNILQILPNETSKGRPIGDEYVSIDVKLKFMEIHGITQSVISLANPWADFIEDYKLVQQLNDDLYNICENSQDKFLGLAVLPLGCKKQEILEEIQRISQMKNHVKGIILSLNGKGQGLYDEDLIDIYAALAQNNLFIFLHPHYGVGNYPQQFGHILPLTLGFTFETTQRVGEFIISGILDRFDQKLKILLAHSGGALGQLSGRLDSCYLHDHHLFHKLQRYDLPSEYLKNCFYYDSICYNKENLLMMMDFVGADKMVFGTDHPFFPPVGKENKNDIEWLSCTKNQQIIKQNCNEDQLQQIMYKTAEDKLFK